MNNVLVLMTALVPTTGHADLITFASNIPNSHVHVVINGRTFEPVPLEQRVTAVKEHFAKLDNVTIYGDMDNYALQSPEGHDHFWEFWKNKVEQVTNITDWSYVIASENYGKDMADVLNARFLPFDVRRELNPIKGDIARKDIWGFWNEILPEFKKNLLYKVTMFGQESVGKTTLSRLVSERLGVNWILEYARPYLEVLVNEVNDETMDGIHMGQYALQKTYYEKALHPVIIQDTDLYSTVGYYGIYGGRVPESIIKNAWETQSDVYYLLPDDIPFEEDPLRYGDGERETNTQYWYDLMTEHNLDSKTHRVHSGMTLEEKVNYIVNDIKTRYNKHVELIKNFERD